MRTIALQLRTAGELFWFWRVKGFPAGQLAVLSLLLLLATALLIYRTGYVACLAAGVFGCHWWNK